MKIGMKRSAVHLAVMGTRSFLPMHVVTFVSGKVSFTARALLGEWFIARHVDVYDPGIVLCTVFCLGG
jgi:hypothetical protein